MLSEAQPRERSHLMNLHHSIGDLAHQYFSAHDRLCRHRPHVHQLFRDTVAQVHEGRGGDAAGGVEGADGLESPP